MLRVGIEYHGYISCGNGYVLRTTDGGNTWTRTQSNPVGDSLFNIQNFYDGLWMDPSDANNLQVMGDAFGVVARSTDGGASWVSQEPSAFAQDYVFQGSTGTPYGTRLAVMYLDYFNSNQGAIGLSYGRIGRTYNGGQTWNVQNQADTATWFTGLAYGPDGALFGTGPHHVILRNDTAEHSLTAESYSLSQPTVSPLLAAAFPSENIGYAVGSHPTGTYGNIIQRYEPVTDFRILNIIPDSASHTVTVQWIDNGESNLWRWGLEFRPRVPFISLNHDAEIQPHGPNISYTYMDTFPVPTPRHYFLNFKVYTYDYDSMSSYPFMIYGPFDFEIPWGYHDSFPAPGLIQVADVDGDEGGQISVSWDPVPGATGYYVGRAENPGGPYCDFYSYTSGTSWLDRSCLVNGRIYYYQVIAHGNDLVSPPSAPGYAVPRDNLPLYAQVQDLSGEYLASKNLIKITWYPPADVYDIAAYWVCPELPDQRYQLAHSAPINRTVYYWPFSDTSQDSAVIAVAAMDYSGHIGPWLSLPVSIQPTISCSNSGFASGLNNARKLLWDAANSRLHSVYLDQNTVYYRTSDDEGLTWSAAESLTPGLYPGLSMDADNELHLICVNRLPAYDPGDPVFDQEEYEPGEYTWQLIYKRTASGAWQGSSYLLDTVRQANNGGSVEYSAPCIAVTSEDTVHVAVSRTSYEQISGSWYWRWQLLYASFPMNDIRISQWTVVDSAREASSAPPPGDCPFNASSPTMVADRNDDISLAWGLYSSIKYCFRKNGQWQANTVISGTGAWQDPHISDNNSEITVVWSGSPPLEPGSRIQCRRRFVPNGKWGNIARLDPDGNLSVYPITLSNNVLWAEEVRPGNYDIFRTWLDLVGWHTPENLTIDSMRSILPQTAYNATADRLYWLWTARDTIPFWLRTDKKDLSGRLLYGFALGADSLSSATLERSGTADYGGGYKRMDVGNRLQYEIPGLDPGRSYELGWTWYHETSGPVPIKLLIDETREFVLSVPPKQCISRRIPIPNALYGDSVIDIKIQKIGSGQAFLSNIAVYDVTSNSGGPQGQTIDMAGVFGLTIYPNPAKHLLTIQYGFNPNQPEANLKIYDVTGRLAKAYPRLTNRGITNNRILWTGDDALGRQLSNGIYFIQLTAGGQKKTEKVILVR